jgi:mannose-6-phosphate isomerase-like protein (cupin superfamily)
MQIIKKDTLPTVRWDGDILARIFDGKRHGSVHVSAFIVDCPVGTGPNLHQHPYEEVFVPIAGTVRMEVDGQMFETTPDEVVIVEAGVPHKFMNIGPGRAQMVNIHANPEVITEFVDDPTANPEYQFYQEA